MDATRAAKASIANRPESIHEREMGSMLRPSMNQSSLVGGRPIQPTTSPSQRVKFPACSSSMSIREMVVTNHWPGLRGSTDRFHQHLRLQLAVVVDIFTFDYLKGVGCRAGWQMGST